jgi:hypothetical protein
MIYVLNKILLVPGKMADYFEINTRELQPLLPKMGVKMAGAFHAYTGNMNEIYLLDEYQGLAEYQKVRKAISQDKEFQRSYAKVHALQVSSHNTILEPNPWSPMK